MSTKWNDQIKNLSETKANSAKPESNLKLHGPVLCWLWKASTVFPLLWVMT